MRKSKVRIQKENRREPFLTKGGRMVSEDKAVKGSAENKDVVLGKKQ